MEVFKCYYCPYKTNSFEEIIDHCSILHEDELLKYRTLILDDLTGILQYQTKTHEGVVLRKIKECGKSLCLSGSYRLIVKDDQISKKKKLNTPIKSAENKYIERSDETADELENLSTYDEIQFLLPKVIKNLEESGQLDSYIKYNELLASGRLPSNNICYLLFLDIVEWFSSENTSQMRYKFPETVKFWQIGNQLFHGKFIRFMSGLRHFGHVVEGSCDRGVFDPSTSRINFAVPSKTTLQSIATKASFYPGINDELLSSLSSHLANKPLNLSVDGKKICRGKGKHMGDINCWGFENKPTLSERQEKLEIDKALMESIITRLDILEGRGIDKINQISKSEKSIIHNELISVVKTLSIRNKQLRETESSLVLSEEKLKKLAGSDWRKSRYFPAIASVRVKRNDIKEHLDESMKLLTKVIRFGAEIADAKERFSSPKVNMDEQANYFCLNPQFESECSRFIRQRTPAWHVVRDQAKVTGSTVHGAIGLDTLKKQQQHFDQKVSGKPKPDFSDEVKERMKYGTVHEIDAIATLTGTVLPFMFPALSYFEEGCLNIRTEMDEQFMVVSPDGSLRTSQERAPAMMYENKCKSPNSYSRYAYYAIPSYYALQILSEMKAYDCDKLLFTCWSMTSMTVFIAHFDNALWDICWSELVKIYGCENPKRPTRFSDVAKQLRPLIREYVEKKVEFLGEFPSCQAQTDKVWDIAETNTDCPYIEPSSPERMIKSSVISDLQDCLVSAMKWINSAYYYSRTVATEILVYMLNDLDRFYQIETNIAHPIAYALKGTSLKGETFTAMLEHVIKSCEEKGLSILTTSSDGQWHRHGVRGNQDTPLTVLQLQIDHWKNVKSKDKATILSEIRRNYKVESLDDIIYEKGHGCGIIVHRHKADTPFVGKVKLSTVTVETEENIDENQMSVEHISDTRIDDNELLTNVCIGLLDESINGNMDQETYNQVQDVVQESVSERSKYKSNTEAEDVVFDIGQWLFADEEEELLSSYSRNCVDAPLVYENTMGTVDKTTPTPQIADCTTVLSEAFKTLYADAFDIDDAEMSPICDIARISEDADRDVAETIHVSSNINDLSSYHNGTDPEGQLSIVANNDTIIEPVETVDKVVLKTAHIEQMLVKLQANEKAQTIHNWKNKSMEDFTKIFRSKTACDKYLHKFELCLCLDVLRCNYDPKLPKKKLIECFLDFKLSDTNQSAPTLRRRQAKCKVESLRKLCNIVLQNNSKDNLAAALAEHTWPAQYRIWKYENTVSDVINIHEGIRTVSWFSRAKVTCEDKLQYHFTDACHILTCIRTKLCSTGIQGLQIEAWKKAALSKDSMLNISVIVDCIDKQDVALARRVFAEDVQSCMLPEFPKEAAFCEMIRHWFEAEDEPGIDAIERCRRRLVLRDWLLEEYNCCKFPPPTRYIRGIPRQTFEALLTHIERKIQLYSCVPDKGYNVRAIGSQPVENFFSTFRDMDPTGQGTPKPDAIPDMMSSAAELDHVRLDPDRGFYMKTSKAEVYPRKEYELMDVDIAATDDNVEPTDLYRKSPNAPTMTQTPLNPVKHQFDDHEKTRKKHRRKSGKISLPSEPAYGEKGVRQYHAKDCSKISAFHRAGMLNIPTFEQENDQVLK